MKKFDFYGIVEGFVAAAANRSRELGKPKLWEHLIQILSQMNMLFIFMLSNNKMNKEREWASPYK